MDITYNDLNKTIYILNLKRDSALNELLTSSGNLEALRSVYLNIDGIIKELKSYIPNENSKEDTGFSSFIKQVYEVNKL